MSELTELQTHLKLLKQQVELKNQTERLLANPDFKAVIEEGYCKAEMQRNMGLAVCEKLTSETRELCNQLAKASAALNNYIDTTLQIGRNAEEDINAVEERIQELMVNGEDE